MLITSYSRRLSRRLRRRCCTAVRSVQSRSGRPFTKPPPPSHRYAHVYPHRFFSLHCRHPYRAMIAFRIFVVLTSVGCCRCRSDATVFAAADTPKPVENRRNAAAVDLPEQWAADMFYRALANFTVREDAVPPLSTACRKQTRSYVRNLKINSYWAVKSEWLLIVCLFVFCVRHWHNTTQSPGEMRENVVSAGCTARGTAISARRERDDDVSKRFIYLFFFFKQKSTKSRFSQQGFTQFFGGGGFLGKKKKKSSTNDRSSKVKWL